MQRCAGILAALAFYAVAVIWLTWPLMTVIRTHLPATEWPCRFDTLYSGWALAHATSALSTAPRQLADGNNFYPARGTFFYGPAAFAALPHFAPVMLATANPTVALNLTFLGAVVLTAWTLHFAVWRWTQSHLAGVAAAATFLMSRWTLWEWLPSTPHGAVLYYFPLIIWLAASSPSRLTPGIALLLLVVAQCLTDLVYVAPAVLAPLTVLGAVNLLSPSRRRSGLMLLGVVGLALIVLYVSALGYLQVRAANPDLDAQTFWPVNPSTYALFGTEIPWGLYAQRAPTAVPTVAVLMTMIGAASYCVAGVRRRSPPAAWFTAGLWTVVGVLISLTPIVRWNGQPIALPSTQLLEWVPLYGFVRIHSRLGVAALVGVALMSGLALDECVRRISARRPPTLARFLRVAITLAFVATLYIQYRTTIGMPAIPQRRELPRSYPVAAALPEGAIFQPILAQPGGPLLELPVGVNPRHELSAPFRSTAPPLHARAMYRSIFHQRPVLNGYASYWPAGFPERMILADRLPDATALAALRQQTGVALVWVHADELPRARRGEWLAIAEAGGRGDLVLLARNDGELLFGAAEPATTAADARGDPALAPAGAVIP